MADETKKPAARTSKGTPKKKPATTKPSAKMASGSRASAIKAKHLVIVESPGKIKSLTRYLEPVLGKGVKVKASYGHVRDMPSKKLSVDVERNFEPTWEIIPQARAQKAIGELKAAAKDAEGVWLATDLDREGEAIAWHVAQAIGLSNGKLDERVRRVTFSEITAEAIAEAFQHPRALDAHLIDAYQARRVLDRLVGYKLSPLLWKKVRRGLSAGRVQSAALRIIVDRERDILAFVPKEYWTIDARMSTKAREFFSAALHSVGGEKVEIADEASANAHVDAIRDAGAYTVSAVRKRQTKRAPKPPFTTSTLQQEASRKLGFSGKRTMALAQQLYEGVAIGDEGQVGLITYMRTDSVNLAPTAIEEIRAYISEHHGERYLPEAPRAYKSKKGAQEAHEAIRPTHVMRRPEQLRQYLEPDQLRLYKLIWDRTVSCQMTDALFDSTSVDITAGDHLLRATGQVMLFDGFQTLYVEGSDDDVDEDAERRLPVLEEGQALNLEDILGTQHFTQPPPRYTDSSLVKALEEFGIGRPSTYQSTVSTLVDREYVRMESRRLFPEDVALVVVDLLVEHFPQIVDLKFTADMEEDLDEVARGHREWHELLRMFYDPFSKLLEKKEHEITRDDLIQETTDERCPKCEGPMMVKLGRWGKFLSCANYPECKGTRQIDGKERPAPVPVEGEMCPECGGRMLLKHGRYGEFLGCENYPTCKHVRPKAIGGFCPKCRDGRLVQRRARGKRNFSGCNRYPDCDYTLWTKPMDEPCPSCGGTMIADETQGSVCLSCGHTAPLPVAAPG